MGTYRTAAALFNAHTAFGTRLGRQMLQLSRFHVLRAAGFDVSAFLFPLRHLRSISNTFYISENDLVTLKQYTRNPVASTYHIACRRRVRGHVTSGAECRGTQRAARLAVVGVVRQQHDAVAAAGILAVRGQYMLAAPIFHKRPTN